MKMMSLSAMLLLAAAVGCGSAKKQKREAVAAKPATSSAAAKVESNETAEDVEVTPSGTGASGSGAGSEGGQEAEAGSGNGAKSDFVTMLERIVLDDGVRAVIESLVGSTQCAPDQSLLESKLGGGSGDAQLIDIDAAKVKECLQENPQSVPINKLLNLVIKRCVPVMTAACQTQLQIVQSFLSN